MIPHIIPKKYENLPLDEITFQGAYIRSMTLIILEGIIAQYIADVKNGLNSIKVTWTREALVTILLRLFLKKEDRRKEKADMPFTPAHRYKLRAWQMIIVMAPLVCDQFVFPDEETLKTIEQALWPILKDSHLTNIR
jgi:hypothetical protein